MGATKRCWVGVHNQSSFQVRLIWWYCKVCFCGKWLQALRVEWDWKFLQYLEWAMRRVQTGIIMSQKWTNLVLGALRRKNSSLGDLLHWGWWHRKAGKKWDPRKSLKRIWWRSPNSWVPGAEWTFPSLMANLISPSLNFVLYSLLHNTYEYKYIYMQNGPHLQSCNRNVQIEHKNCAH